MPLTVYEGYPKPEIDAKRVIKMISLVSGWAERHITLDTHLRDDLGLESIDITELEMDFEEAFEIYHEEVDLHWGKLTVKQAIAAIAFAKYGCD